MLSISNSLLLFALKYSIELKSVSILVLSVTLLNCFHNGKNCSMSFIIKFVLYSMICVSAVFASLSNTCLLKDRSLTRNSERIGENFVKEGKEIDIIVKFSLSFPTIW